MYGSSLRIVSGKFSWSVQVPRTLSDCFQSCGSWLRAFLTMEARSMGLRHALSSSDRRAEAMPWTRLVRICPAFPHPMWSRSSKALLQKSTTCPPSM